MLHARCLPLAFLLAAVVFPEATQAQLVAESGFNDQTGIHADATPNWPYEFSVTIKGRGTLTSLLGSGREQLYNKVFALPLDEGTAHIVGSWGQAVNNE